MTTDTAIPMSAEPTTPPAATATAANTTTTTAAAPAAAAPTTTAAPAAASAPVSKELKAIEAVADKVNGIERDLNALAERTTAYAANLCARLWQHQHHTKAAAAAADDTTPKASGSATTATTTTAAVRAVAYRLRMDTHWADEALMKCLFTLDNVFGDDHVKQQRKAQVSRIKQLIAVAEALTVRLRRLEPLLKRLPAPPVAAASEPTATVAATAVDTKTADTKAPAAAEAPVAMETTTTTTATAPAADHLDHKHTPPAPTPAAAARPASPPAAAAPTKSRSPSPTPSSSAGSAAAPAAAPGESTTFVIPENVKAQWPRLRPEFETTSNPATGSIRLSADLSGVRDEDLSVSLSEQNTVLTVRGLLRPKPPVRRLVRRARPQQRRQASWWFGTYDDEYDDEEEDQDVYEDEEQPFGWFEEQFTLPPRLGLDATRAERRFVDGQLTIVLPRAAQRPPSPPKAQPQPSHYGYARQQQPQYAHAAPRRAMYNPFFGGWF